MADGKVEFYNIGANKTVVLFLFNSFKQLDHGGRVFPLVEFGCFHDFAVDSVEDILLILPISDLVGLISRQVGFLAKFGLWSFSVLISSSVYSVIDTKFRCDFFVFRMNVSYGIGMRFL